MKAKRILSLILASSLLLTAAGCGESTKPSKSTSKNKDAEIVDFEEMDEGSGTVQIENNYTDSKGEEHKETIEVDVDDVNTPSVGNSNPAGTGNFKPESYEGLDKNESEKIEDDSNNGEEAKYRTFYVTEYVHNTSDKYFACKDIVVTGEVEGMWVRKSLEAEYCFGPGMYDYITIYGIVDTTKYKSDEEIEKAFKNFKINLAYTLTDNNDGDVEWDNAKVYYLKIN